MKKFLTVLLSIVCVSCFSLLFIGCNNENDNDNANKDEQIVAIYNTYVAYAEDNGQTPLSYEDWLASIKGEKGDKGDTGANGQDGKTPTIEIIDGYWYINGENSGVKAEGKDGINGTNGTNGTNGATPTIEIIDGYWYINGENSGVKAEGKDGVNGTNGTNGVDGKTPTIEIIDGYWYINGDNTGVKAEGKDGLNGMNGKGIKSAVIDSNGDLIITFDDNTWVNAGNIVPKNPILDENNKIIFNNIAIEDNNGFIKVENGTTTFSFLDEIEIRGNANYTVSTDITGLNVIPTKTVNLDIGDNVFYILETCGNDANLYTITIRRDLHAVKFNTNGGTSVEDILVKTEETIPVPTSHRNGYGLSWNFDFETPITEDITIDATWTAIFTTDGGTITGLTEYGQSLTKIEIPGVIDGSEITILGRHAITGGEITNLIIPNTITEIKECAIACVPKLNDFIIPSSVQKIEPDAFFEVNCNIDIDENNVNFIVEEGVLFNKEKTRLIKYLLTNDKTQYTVPETVKEIDKRAFYRAYGLYKINIGSNVEKIGDSAFYNSGLQSVIIPSNVGTLGDSVFGMCQWLSSVEINIPVQNMGLNTFTSCYNIKEVILNIPGDGIPIATWLDFNESENVKLYYNGTRSNWVSISWEGADFSSITVFYYIENESEVPKDGGNYWHYVDGVPTIWNILN